jgi:proteasome beta subunit
VVTRGLVSKPDPGSSFIELLRQRYGPLHPGDGASGAQNWREQLALHVAHGTTVLAIRYVDGVVMAADRRAVSGTQIVLRTAEKLFPTDRLSGIAVSGVPGPALEIARLLRTEFEHYEKVEGISLSLEGKANRLSSMLRDHLPSALLGLVVVPIFAGFDTHSGRGRLFAFDVTGGRYEEWSHCVAGSGAVVASTTIALGFQDGLDRTRAIALALEAMHQAAEQDSFTGGVDEMRRIYPSMAVIDASGYQSVADSDLAPFVAQIIHHRDT